MQDIDVELEGEFKINPIKYQRIITRIVGANNPTSGKIYLPREYVSQKVVVLLPKVRSHGNGTNSTKRNE